MRPPTDYEVLAMANWKSSLFEDGTGSRDAEGKVERVMLYPDNPDKVFVYPDPEGKLLFGVKRGEGVDTPKAYQVFNAHYRDTDQDIEFARQNHQPYRGNVIETREMSNALREQRGLPAGKYSIYRMDEVAALPPGSKVLEAEGEPDAEACWRVRVPATAVFGTGTSAHKQHWGEALAEKEVIATYDLDNGGLRRCVEVVTKFQSYSDKDPGKPMSLRIMKLEDKVEQAPVGFDICDFLSFKAREMDAADAELDKDDRGKNNSGMTYAERWAVLNSPPLPQNIDHYLYQLFTGEVSTQDCILPGIGEVRYGRMVDGEKVAVRYDELMGEDVRLLNALGEELRKAIGWTHDASRWKAWAENVLSFKDASAPGGRLHGWFRLSHGSNGKPTLARKVREDAQGSMLREYSPEDANKEFSDLPMCKYFKEGANDPAFTPMVKWAWDNNMFHHYVETTFRPGDGPTVETLDGAKLNNYIQPHDGPPVIENPIPYEDHPLVFIWRVHAQVEKDVDIGMSFLANVVQHPAGPLGWGLGVQTPPGGGKGTIDKIMYHCVDNGFGHMNALNIKKIKGTAFTEDFLHKTFVVIDETSNAARDDLISVGETLKTLSSEPMFSFGVKHEKSKGQRPNHVKMLFQMNADSGMAFVDDPASDRRFAFIGSKYGEDGKEEMKAAFDVQWWKDTHPEVYAEADENSDLYDGETPPWFRVMYYWLEKMGGYEDCRHLLLNYDIKYGSGDRPKSSTHNRIAGASMPAWASLLMDVLEDGEVPFAGGVIPAPAIPIALSRMRSSAIPNEKTVGRGVRKHLNLVAKGRYKATEEVAEFLNSIGDNARWGTVKVGSSVTYYSADPELDGKGRLMSEMWLKAQKEANEATALELADARGAGRAAGTGSMRDEPMH